MIVPDSKKRMGFTKGSKEVRKHMWLKGVDWLKANSLDGVPTPWIPDVDSSEDLRHFDGVGDLPDPPLQFLTYQENLLFKDF